MNPSAITKKTPFKLFPIAITIKSCTLVVFAGAGRQPNEKLGQSAAGACITKTSWCVSGKRTLHSHSHDQTQSIQGHKREELFETLFDTKLLSFRGGTLVGEKICHFTTDCNMGKLKNVI